MAVSSIKFSRNIFSFVPFLFLFFISYEVFRDCSHIPVLMKSKFKRIIYLLFPLKSSENCSICSHKKKKRIAFTGIQPESKSIHIYSHCYKKVTSSKFKITTLNQSVGYISNTNDIVFNQRPAVIYLLIVNNRSTRKRCEICSKLTSKTPERRHWSRSGVFEVNFKHISHPALVLL